MTSRKSWPRSAADRSRPRRGPRGRVRSPSRRPVSSSRRPALARGGSSRPRASSGCARRRFPRSRASSSSRSSWTRWRLAREAEKTLPDEIARLRKENWVTFSVTTDPPGADAVFAHYLGGDSEWTPAGKTPLEAFALPLAYYRWRFTMPGHQTVGGPTESLKAAFRLEAVAAVPPGMVRVPGGPFSLRSLGAVTLGDFWLDGRRSRTASTRRSSTRAGTRRACTGRSRSRRTAVRSRSRKRSPTSTTRRAARAPRRGSSGRTPRAATTSRSAA